MKNIYYLMDDINFAGGAHVASFEQIKFLQTTGLFKIHIVSLTQPKGEIIAQFPFVNFIYSKSKKHKTTEVNTLLQNVPTDGIVCVPFENSVFRVPASNLQCAKKIQWVHIDYAYWYKLNPFIEKMTMNDGELYKKFDSIVFVSYASKNGFSNIYPHLESKCVVCYNLFDIENILTLANRPQFDGEEYFHSKDGRLKLLTIARLDNQQKGIARHLLVADRLKKNGYRFEWVFAGDGLPEDKEVIQTMVTHFNLGDCVRFIGQKKNPYAIIKQADLFCLFSFYEGIPNTIFEAHILETPVIATEISGTREQIKPEYGWLVRNTTEDIYAGLESILKNPEKLAAVKENLAQYRYPNEGIKETVQAIFSDREEQCAMELEKKIKVSVIVPVYNVENYLEECLLSLEKQTLQDIEIILVDDGSTDNSSVILNDFARRKPELFKLFTKANGGLGDARNFGIQQASGEYLAFIDSDDFVEPTMMEELYQAGVTHGCDIVLADLYGFDNVTGYSTVEKSPFSNSGVLDMNSLLLHATRPVVVSACTKIYRRSIFAKWQFPEGWYEDMGLIPILFSYAEKVYYLAKPLYHYRWNRAGSIQSQKADEKTLEIFKSKTRVLEQSNPDYLNEISFAVYEHAVRFYNSQPHFRNETLEYIAEKQMYFHNNSYIKEAIANDELLCLFKKEYRIPKKIHYCWFGKGIKSRNIEKCIASWKKHLPDYEIVEWNENNCDINENNYTKTAYENEKWAYVSDYFRFKALWEQGGIYLDTDMYVYKPLDELLYYNAFFGIETYAYVHGGIIGAAPNSPLVKEILNSYKKDTYSSTEQYTVCNRLTDILLKGYNFKQNGCHQVLPGGIALLEPNVVTVNFSDGACLAEHLYDGSWLDGEATEGTFKNDVMMHYYLYPFFRKYAEQKLATNLNYVTVGTPYAIVDENIKKFGLGVVLRQAAKAILRKILPAKLYLKLEDKAING